MVGKFQLYGVIFAAGNTRCEGGNGLWEASCDDCNVIRLTLTEKLESNGGFSPIS